MNDVVVITGAAGFAGSHVIEHLAGREDIVGWARSAPPAEMRKLARWQHVDLLDREQVRAAVRDVRPSAVYHCGGLPHVAQSWNDTAEPLAANVLATHHLLDALRRAEVACRVLIPSSATIYAPSHAPIGEDGAIAPASPYALSKLAQEQLAIRAVREDGIDVVVARAFNHTGPRQTPAFVAPSVARQIALIERGEQEPVLKVGNVSATRDLLDVRDVAGAYAALMRMDETAGVYNVASGVGRTIRDILDALVTRARVAIRIETDPARLRANDVPVLIGDARRLRDRTGWRPLIPFERTMDDLLEHWRQRAAAGAS